MLFIIYTKHFWGATLQPRKLFSMFFDQTYMDMGVNKISLIFGGVMAHGPCPLPVPSNSAPCLPPCWSPSNSAPCLRCHSALLQHRATRIAPTAIPCSFAPCSSVLNLVLSHQRRLETCRSLQFFFGLEGYNGFGLRKFCKK